MQTIKEKGLKSHRKSLRKNARPSVELVVKIYVYVYNSYKHISGIDLMGCWPLNLIHRQQYNHPIYIFICLNNGHSGDHIYTNKLGNGAQMSGTQTAPRPVVWRPIDGAQPAASKRWRPNGPSHIYICEYIRHIYTDNIQIKWHKYSLLRQFKPYWHICQYEPSCGQYIHI